MNFIEGLASAITVALLTGLPVFWYKDQALYRIVGRSLLIAVASIYAGGGLFTIGYSAGMGREHVLTSEAIAKVRFDINKALQVPGESEAEAFKREVAVDRALPVALHSISLHETLLVLPVWFWACISLLMFELILLNSTYVTRSSVPAGNKSDNRTS